jgi:hypothetical protein
MTLSRRRRLGPTFACSICAGRRLSVEATTAAGTVCAPSCFKGTFLAACAFLCGSAFEKPPHEKGIWHRAPRSVTRSVDMAHTHSSSFDLLARHGGFCFIISSIHSLGGSAHDERGGVCT